MINNNLYLENIDQGKGFDWGRTSADYARYRDIYPPEFYQRIVDLGLCVQGHKVLDLGTGTGVLPRNMACYGAAFTGTDVSENQIKMARKMSAEAGLDIQYRCASAEESIFPDASFDVITACQCFFYFKHEVLAPQLYRMLKENGRVAVLYMAWLPYEDAVAGASEELILKYNPAWSGCGEMRHPIEIHEAYDRYFECEHSEVFDLKVPFTRESWNGRIRACRGVGASLSPERLMAFEQEHRQMLLENAPETFKVLHYAAVKVLKKRKNLS